MRLALHLYAENVTGDVIHSQVMQGAQKPVQTDFVPLVGLEQVPQAFGSLAQQARHTAHDHHTPEAYPVGRPYNQSQDTLEALNIVARSLARNLAGAAQSLALAEPDS